MSKRIAAITRLRDTRKGNPVYHVEFDDGTAASTVRDGPVGEYAGNIGWVGVDLDIEWDGERVAGWKPADSSMTSEVADSTTTS
jgi:hypothetical protein